MFWKKGIFVALQRHEILYIIFSSDLAHLNMFVCDFETGIKLLIILKIFELDPPTC